MQIRNSWHGFFLAGVGVYISRVEEGSVAERSGLRPGDTILEVNGTPFTAIGHEEALKVIRKLFFFCIVCQNTIVFSSLWVLYLEFLFNLCALIIHYVQFTVLV